MTGLDFYQPQGEPIHPYDVYDLLVAPGASLKELCKSPKPDGLEDYIRNENKCGEELLINGKHYFQTCRVPYKSTSFPELVLPPL